jgi:hypothetical protein
LRKAKKIRILPPASVVVAQPEKRKQKQQQQKLNNFVNVYDAATISEPQNQEKLCGVEKTPSDIFLGGRIDGLLLEWNTR